MRDMPSFVRTAAILLCAFALLAAGCAVPDRLLFAAPRLESRDIPEGLPLAEVLFPSGDEVLCGWYVPGEPGRPLVLYFHGTATNLAREAAIVRLLRERLGVSVFAFDYRGFGASGGHPTVAGTRADARAALEMLESLGWRPERTVYFGRSLGAAVALELALESPPAGLVLESAFTSLVDLITWRHPATGTWLPWIFPDYYNNLEKIAAVRAPLLLIHGSGDTVVPSHMAQRLFARAPEPKTLLLVPGGDHDAPREGSAGDYWAAWRHFLARRDVDPEEAKSAAK